MKQKITVLLEVKNIFEYTGVPLMVTVLKEPHCTSPMKHIYEYSGVPSIVTFLVEPYSISTRSF